MRYSFRLAQLLGHDPDTKKRPGTVKAIVNHTGLDRHKIAALLRNDVKYLPLDTISRVCDYLIDRGIASPDKLPGALFAVEPESFWELLARRASLSICVGMRQGVGEYLDDSWVVTADSLLLGVLLNGVSTLGGTARYYPKSDAPRDAAGAVARAAPHPDEYVQWLVLAPREGNESQVIQKAKEVYDGFDRGNTDRALVCLGSVKSNPVVELVMSRAFGAAPFVSQDQAAKPQDRRCPVWLHYREGQDFNLPSCGGGVRLSKTEKPKTPGIYYERADGSWARCEWNEETRDAALIFYHYLPALGRLEMAVGGFSSRSTRFLSQVLTPGVTSRLWPPTYETPSVQIGAFLAAFKFAPDEPSKRDILSSTYGGEVEIIALEKEVIERRLQTSEGA